MVQRSIRLQHDANSHKHIIYMDFSKWIVDRYIDQSDTSMMKISHKINTSVLDILCSSSQFNIYNYTVNIFPSKRVYVVNVLSV